MSKRVTPDSAPDYLDNGKPEKKAPILIDRSARTYHRLRSITNPKAPPAEPEATDPYDSPAPRTEWD